MVRSLILAAAAVPLAAAAPWAQPKDHPIYGMFKRQATTTYPVALQVPTEMPQIWLDKLHAVSDEIRDVPVSVPRNGTENQVVYPDGMNPYGAEICAFPNCFGPNDITGAPDATWLATFDDGPGKGTIKLADFLESKNMSQHATHFMIGGAIVALPDQVKYVFDRGGQIASHTWSHKRMTTLTNEQIVSELGWTMQAIMDHTGGRLPGYWRPPYGDIDNRVRDVAEKVFDLTAVMWNADSSDWKIAREGKAPVEKVFDDWATGPKSPGLNTLMHEINPDTVDIFISRYDNFTANGWKIMNVAEAFNQDMYVNAADNTATVTDMSIAQIGVNVENKISATTTGGVATISAHTTVDSGPVTAATDVPPLTPTGSATTATTTGSGSSGSSGASSSPSSSSGENKSSAARSLLAPLATVIVVAFGAALF